MQLRFSKLERNPWAIGFLFLIWTLLSSLSWAIDLPSGLPDDLSDSSAYNPCLGTLCGVSPPRDRWYFQADALFLRRDRIDPVPLQTLGNQGDVALSTDAINTPFRAGPRLLMGYTLGDSRWQIDGTYFFIDNWADTEAVLDLTNNHHGGQGNLFSPFSNFGHPPIHGYDYNDSVSINESSQLQNGELNLRYLVPMPHECLTAKLILGLRYTSVDEQFGYLSQSQVPLPLGSAASISTRTTNDLFGPQIGGEFYFYIYPRCWIDLGIKGALCDNHALQDTTGTLTNNAGVSTTFNSSKVRDATAYVGDLDLALVWQITPRILTRIGYQALWINDLALASRNFAPPAVAFEPPPIASIDTIGRAVYHGPHIGLEFNW